MEVPLTTKDCTKKAIWLPFCRNKNRLHATKLVLFNWTACEQCFFEINAIDSCWLDITYIYMYIHTCTYITWPLPQRGFSGPMETNNANEHNMVKNPTWQEAEQLAIYKRGRGAVLGSTKKQLQLSDQSGFKVQRPLGHAASIHPTRSVCFITNLPHGIKLHFCCWSCYNRYIYCRSSP